MALDATTLRPEYDTDGLHLNAAGYAAEAAIMRHAVAPIRRA